MGYVAGRVDIYQQRYLDHRVASKESNCRQKGSWDEVSLHYSVRTIRAVGMGVISAEE